MAKKKPLYVSTSENFMFFLVFWTIGLSVVVFWFFCIAALFCLLWNLEVTAVSNIFPLSILPPSLSLLNWHTFPPRSHIHAQMHSYKHNSKHASLTGIQHVTEASSLQSHLWVFKSRKKNPSSFAMEINTFTSISITFPLDYQHFDYDPVSFMIMMPIMVIITVVMMVMMIVFVITLLIDCGLVRGAIFQPLNSFCVEFAVWSVGKREL